MNTLIGLIVGLVIVLVAIICYTKGWNDGVDYILTLKGGDNNA